MVGTPSETSVGRPLVPAAEVHAVRRAPLSASPGVPGFGRSAVLLPLRAAKAATLLFVVFNVTAQVVEEQVRDAKQIIFKKRRRKNSRRTTAHRQVRQSGVAAAAFGWEEDLATIGSTCPQSLESQIAPPFPHFRSCSRR